MMSTDDGCSGCTENNYAINEILEIVSYALICVLLQCWPVQKMVFMLARPNVNRPDENIDSHKSDETCGFHDLLKIIASYALMDQMLFPWFHCKFL